MPTTPEPAPLETDSPRSAQAEGVVGGGDVRIGVPRQQLEQPAHALKAPTIVSGWDVRPRNARIPATSTNSRSCRSSRSLPW